MSSKIQRVAAGLLSAAFLFCAVPVRTLALEPAAQLTAAQVTVRFDLSGASGEAPAPLYGEQGDRLTLPATQVAAPYGAEDQVFTGWSARLNASTPDYLPGDSIVLTGDQTLYAIFEKKPDERPAKPKKPNQVPSQPAEQNTSFTLRDGEHQKFMDGGSDGLFHPSQALSRAELAQMLYTVVVDRTTNTASFPDVEPGSWYASAVETMAGLGILEGYADGSFRPSQPVTRAESAAALAKLIPAGGSVRSFPDVSSSDKDYDAISAVGGYGLFSGDGNGNFNPAASLTRAEAAVVFNKLLGRVPDSSAVRSNPSLRYFPDVPTTHWAYPQVMEAVTSHGHMATAGGGEVWQNVQAERVALADGFHRIGGRLYLVQNGRFLRSTSYDVFTFDAEGRYTTGDAALDTKLNAIIEQLTNSSMSQDQKLQVLFNYCRDSFTYLKRPLIEKGQTGWEPEYATYFLANGKGNCYNFSAAYCLMCRNLGLPAYTVVGRALNSPHGWVEIVMDGTTYIFDPQLAWRYLHYWHKTGYNFFKVDASNPTVEYTR